MDDLALERDYAARGYGAVAGVDEVGRGPLAGPVVCAAVILPLEEALRIRGIDDSKRLSRRRREELAALIRDRAVAFSVCEADAALIDEINILQATRRCMKGAVELLSPAPDFVLTDGNMTLEINIPQRSIVKGDALVASIGAASILAKVYRDALMASYAAQYPGYGFERNAGYGTAEHIRAIRERGICAIHRRSFLNRILEEKGKSSS